MEKFSFDQHLKQEHRVTPFSTYIEEFVYGGNDGIVTTFAVVSGFSGAAMGDHAVGLTMATVLLFGLANLIADGAAMGLGNFLSIRSAQRLYDTAYQKELYETQHSKDYELEETEFLFQKQGFNSDDAKQLTAIVSKNTDFWVKFMVQHECDLEDKRSVKAIYNGCATFVSFVLFGSIPLLPYFFDFSVDVSFYLAIGCTCFSLSLLGLLQAFVTKMSAIKAVFETLVVGGTASSLAYGVGLVFKYVAG